MIKITPNEMHRAKIALEELGNGQKVTTRFRIATLVRQLDGALEVFKSTMKSPDMSQYEEAIHTIYGEDLKGQAEKKLQLLEETNKKFSKELAALKKFNQKSEEDANTPLETDIMLLKLSDLPEAITTTQLAILLPLIAQDE